MLRVAVSAFSRCSRTMSASVCFQECQVSNALLSRSALQTSRSAGSATLRKAVRSMAMVFSRSSRMTRAIGATAPYSASRGLGSTVRANSITLAVVAR
jgi:hypothetical protein